MPFPDSLYSGNPSGLAQYDHSGNGTTWHTVVSLCAISTQSYSTKFTSVELYIQLYNNFLAMSEDSEHKESERLDQLVQVLGPALGTHASDFLPPSNCARIGYVNLDPGHLLES